MQVNFKHWYFKFYLAIFFCSNKQRLLNMTRSNDRKEKKFSQSAKQPDLTLKLVLPEQEVELESLSSLN